MISITSYLLILLSLIFLLFLFKKKKLSLPIVLLWLVVIILINVVSGGNSLKNLKIIKIIPILRGVVLLVIVLFAIKKFKERVNVRKNYRRNNKKTNDNKKYARFKKRGGRKMFNFFGKAKVQEEEAIYRYVDKKVEEYFLGEAKSGCFGKKGISDDVYENKVLSKINEVASKEVALVRLGLDETQVQEIEPMCFRGFEEEDGCYSRYGLDGKFRTSQYSVTWLFFGSEELYIFSVFLDLLHDSVRYSTQEYFYKEITSFYTSSNNFIYESTKTKKGCISFKSFTEQNKVVLNKFYLKVPGDDFYCSVSGVADADRIIQGLKQKIREKKQNG